MSKEHKFTRKLKAILSSDVKGYSLLIADDEVHTIQTLKAYRTIMSDLIHQQSGRIVDNPGDNLLAEFSSAVNAVECATQIQNRLKKANARFVEEKRLQFRIGINIGDVIQDGDRIYGSGVNVAARIEGIADPGGICISRNTYDHVKNKLDLSFDYLGEHKVKNIKEPVRVYKILMDTDSDNGSVHQMKDAPRIVVQLVHIGGPRKGVIQEFTEHDIYIGRHPSCQVKFPDELYIVSRKHARISREGNRFQLVDESSNGTFINGKRVNKAYLKNGDILTFAEDGPKVSFLTKISESQSTGLEPRELEKTVQQTGSPGPYAMISPQGRPLSPNNSPQTPSHAESSDKPSPRPKKDPAIQKENVPLIIQHGPTLQSFDDLPIVIGRNVNCNFIIDQSSILDQHAQIFFYENKFWIKDLTGKQCLRINGNPVIEKRALVIEDILTLSDQGPSFRFLGGGRLSEVKQATNLLQKDSTSSTNTDSGRKKKKKKSKFSFKIW